MERKLRDSNIELLRIIAMIMIISSHYVVHGIKQWTEVSRFQKWSEGSLSHQLFANLLASAGGNVGVAIFFMIAGYFCVKKNSSIKKVVCETAFYGVLTGVFYIAFRMIGMGGQELYDGSDINNLFKQIFNPVSSGTYWFVTVYVVLIIVSPVLNNFFNKLNERGAFLFLVCCFIFWYVCAEFESAIYYAIERGILFYFAGGYIRRFIDKKKINSLLCWGLFFVSWISYGILNYWSTIMTLKRHGTGIEKLIIKFSASICNDIFVPLAAIFIFLAFLKMDIGCKKRINIVASTTFGIYLIHDSAVLRTIIWDDIYKVASWQYLSPFFYVLMVSTVISVFVVCALIDLTRQKFLEKRIINKVNEIEERFKDKYMR